MGAKKLEIDFHEDHFTRVFYENMDAVFDPNIRRIVNVGSGGSTKSWSLAQICTFLMMDWMPNKNGLILRKVGRTLKTSVIPLFIEEVLPLYGLKDFFNWNKSDRELTCIATGSKAYFLGMDDPEKVKSVPGIGWIWPEETTEFDEADLSQLTVRLRGVENPLEFYSYNPVSELHPLCKEYQIHFKQHEHPTTRVIQSTYKDNPWIVGPMLRDESFFVEMERFKRKDPTFYQIYYLGQPGVIGKGGEFYRAFDQNEHVIPVEPWDPEAPLHLAVDENVLPFMAWNFFQAEGNVAKQIGEVHLDNIKYDPLNGEREGTSVIDRSIREMKKKFPPKKTASTLYVYGDSTSRKRDAKLDWGENLYSILKRKLEKAGYRVQLRVPISNPSVSVRGNWQNEEVFGKEEGPQLFICDNCESTLLDYVYVKTAEDGSKLKKRIKDKETGQTFEEFGHASDANDYFLARYFRREFNKWKRGGSARKRQVGRRSYSSNKSY